MKYFPHAIGNNCLIRRPIISIRRINEHLTSGSFWLFQYFPAYNKERGL